MDWKIWGLLIAFALCLTVLLVKQFWPSYQDDNIVEEKVEDVLKNTTSVDVDLTPNSPEQK